MYSISDEGNSEKMHEVGSSFYAARMWDEAERCYSEYVHKGNDIQKKHDSAMQIARIKAQKHDHAGAIGSTVIAVGLAPGANSESYLFLCTYLFKIRAMHMWSCCVAAFLAEHPNDELAKEQRALYLYYSGDTDRSEKEYETLAGSSNDEVRKRCSDGLKWCRKRSGVKRVRE